MSENLDPGGFVILWMIQVGTWRETLWGKGFWLDEVVPLNLAVYLGGNNKRTPGGGRLAPRSAGGRGSGQCTPECGSPVSGPLCAPVLLVCPGFLTGGWRRPFCPRLTQYGVAQQEAGTSLFCFVAFARSPAG